MIKYKEFALEDIFCKIKSPKIKGKAADFPTTKKDNYKIPLLTAGVENQGLSRFAKEKDCPKIISNVISISANGANTGATFYQDDRFAILQDAYAIKLRAGCLNREVGLYLTSLLNKKLHGSYDWSNKATWNRIKKLTIKIPILDDESINYNYINNYIAELEQQRLAELDSYLKATYDQAKAKLNQAKADTQQAQDKLNSLKSNLSDLQNADENATKAVQALTDATTKLAQAKKSADDLATKLVEVKATLAEKETALTTAKSVLAKIEKEEVAKEAVKKAQEEDKKAAEEKAEHTNFYKAGNDKLLDSKGQVMPSDYTVKENKVYDAKGEFVGVVSSKVESRVVAHAIAKVESKENTTSNSNVNSAIASSSNTFSTYAPKHAEAHTVKAGSVLPTTGSHDTNLAGVIGLALASVGSLLGLASSKKKNLR